MTRDLPPDLDGAVHAFVDRMGEVRTGLIRRRAELAEARRPEPPSEPYDYFDFDHPISSCVR